MEPIDIQPGVVRQIARHYANNHKEIGPKSVKDLAALYGGVSHDTMRRSLRAADEILAVRGETLTAPEGHNGWRVEPTTSERRFAVTTRSRITAIEHELSRYNAKAQTVSDSDPIVRRMYEDVVVAIDMALETLADIAGTES